MSYFQALLLLHILSAIVGIGPSFGFGVLGPMSAKLGGPGALAIMEGMHAIDRRLVTPAAIIQPTTGLLLIFSSGRNFWQSEWLWISVILYAGIIILVYGFNNPAFSRMIAMAKEGKAETPDFQAKAKRVKALGPIIPILAVAIIVLMVLKPG